MNRYKNSQPNSKAGVDCLWSHITPVFFSDMAIDDKAFCICHVMDNNHSF